MFLIWAVFNDDQVGSEIYWLIKRVYLYIFFNMVYYNFFSLVKLKRKNVKYILEIIKKISVRS